MYYLKTIQKDLEHYAPATAQKNINLGILYKVVFPVPPKEEQQEIVNRVESLFAKADKIEAQYEKLKTKIEQLPQAILHKAFKGELVPQLESDGDARELLREIEGLKSITKRSKSTAIREKSQTRNYKPPKKKSIKVENVGFDGNNSSAKAAKDNTLVARDKKMRRKMLATYIINQSLDDKNFGKTKFEKLLHLIEYHVVKSEYNQTYSVQAAGPYDSRFTRTFWKEVLKSKWFAFKEMGTLKRIVPGANHSKSLKDYNYFSNSEKQKISAFISIFKGSNYERPEIISTLYAVWNNRIIRNEMITDALLKKDFLEWDTQKSKYKDRLDRAIFWMKKEEIIPDGWGKIITRSKEKRKTNEKK